MNYAGDTMPPGESPDDVPLDPTPKPTAEERADARMRRRIVEENEEAAKKRTAKKLTTVQMRAVYEAAIRRKAFEEVAELLDTEETGWAEEEHLCDNEIDRLSCTAKETECHRLAMLVRALAKAEEQAGG